MTEGGTTTCCRLMHLSKQPTESEDKFFGRASEVRLVQLWKA